MKGFLEKLLFFSHDFWREFRPILFVRPMTKFLVTNYEGGLVGVEIGVAHGHNAKTVLTALPNIKRLYLIDPWSMYSGSNDKIYKYAQKNLRIFSGKTKFIQKFSNDAVNDIPNNVDFIYIDGDKHTYKQAIGDIEKYYPKVRKGGVLGGHDFDGYFPAVCEAVIDFSRKKKVKLHTGKNDWWIVKSE